MNRQYKNAVITVFLVHFISACSGPITPNNGTGTYKIAYLGRDYHLFTLDDIYAPKITVLDTTGGVDYLKWSPSLNRIAFISSFSSIDDPTYSTGLFTIRPDGRERKLLLPMGLMGVGLTTELAWSPDGSKIAYVSNVEPNIPGEQNIWVVNNDGSNPRKLTNGGFNIGPTWFPDNTHLGYVRLEHSHEDTTLSSFYYIINSATNEPPRALPKRGTDPVFSLDGSLMAIGFEAALHTSEDLGITYTQILDDTTARAFNRPIGFSGDGQRIFFESYIDWYYRITQAEITTVKLDGTDRQVLLPVENLARATLSPDRKKILVWTWVRGQDGHWWLDLYILSVDGSEYFKLVEEVKSPTWGPVN